MSSYLSDEIGAEGIAEGSVPESSPAPMLPSYEEFTKDTVVVDQITEIAKFSFTVFYLNNGALTHESVSEAVLAATLSNLSDVLVSTGIDHRHLIEAVSQRAQQVGGRLDDEKAAVSITQKHSVFPFSIRVYGDRFVISRDSSSFRDFYNWYRLFMPIAAELEATVRQTVARKFEQPLDVIQTNFEFQFVFSDFHKGQSKEGRPPRNVDVLSALLPSVPNQDGPSELAKQEFPRLDLTVSRLEKLGSDENEKWRNCWYTLEAPSNERSRFIVFNAQLRNVSAEPLGEAVGNGEAPTIAFDPDFSGDYVLAVEDFLKRRALEDFMGKLLENWKFRTQRQL